MRSELRRIRASGQLKNVKAVQRWDGTKDLAKIAPKEQGLAMLRGMTKSRKFFGKIITSSAKTANIASSSFSPHSMNIRQMQMNHGPEWKSALSKTRGIWRPGQNAAASITEKAAGVADWVGKHKEHLTHGTEIAGLGVLGYPSYQRLKKIRAKETSPEERRSAKFELAGLGILGIPSAIGLAHGAYSKLRPR
jgi:uncharacterized membrane protein YebE (DUF533 family)